MTATATLSSGSDAANDVELLRARIAGDVLTPSHPEYDAARAVHNLAHNRRPALIVRAAQTSDVAEAVRFARAAGLEIAVRSGGHSLAGHGVIDGALVIDLSRMRQISIDPEHRTARVQPGATSGDLAGPAHAYGLALSTGDTSTVALGGLTTGGGIGWFVRKHGLTIDSLVSAEVVTAEGAVIRASLTENADLFWALRGGGGNFGIVTELELRLIQAGAVVGGILVFPATRAAIRSYLEYTPTAPDELTTTSQVMHAPPAPFIPPHMVGKPVFLVTVCYAGDEAAAATALAPLRAVATPIVDLVSAIPYPVMYNFTEAATLPTGCTLRSMFSRRISDASLDAVLEAMDNATSPASMVQFRGLGGAMARVSEESTAFAHRTQPYVMTVLGLWYDPSEDPTPHRDWTEALWNVIRREGDGVYANFVGDEGEERIREAYPAATYARLAEVKRRYDPDNVFHYNQNIQPSPRA